MRVRTFSFQVLFHTFGLQRFTHFASDLGEAKAADKMVALFGSSTLVVRELLAANPTVSESLVAVMLAADVDEDEPIDSLLALVFEASNFAERVHNCGSD